MRAIESIVALRADNILHEDEAFAAVVAEARGTDDHTIGYEVEITESARADVPAINDDHSCTTVRELCHGSLNKYGYGISSDEVVELSSPYSKSPNSLTFTTIGLIRLGWLPVETSGLITAHVSIGTPEDLGPEADPHFDLIRMLRAIEQTGVVRPERITSTLDEATTFNSDGVPSSGWGVRGNAGIYIPKEPREHHAWHGANNRIELRSLQYIYPEQFMTTLRLAYFFSRALLSPDGSNPREQYREFDDWFRDYCESMSLLDFENIGDKPLGEEPDLNDYLYSYADNLSNDRTPVARAAQRLVENLTEEFGMI